MKINMREAVVLIGLGGLLLLLGGCATMSPVSGAIPINRDALVGHWKAESYINTIDLRMNPDGSFEARLFTFDIEDDRLTGTWSLSPGDRLVMVFRGSKRPVYGMPFDYVRVVEELTAKSFSLRRIETFFNPLGFVRLETL